jgi:hypothetical protein
MTRLLVHAVRAEGHWRCGQFWGPVPRTVEVSPDVAAALRASSLLVVAEVRSSAPTPSALEAKAASPVAASTKDSKPGPAATKDTVAPAAGKGS